MFEIKLAQYSYVTRKLLNYWLRTYLNMHLFLIVPVNNMQLCQSRSWAISALPEPQLSNLSFAGAAVEQSELCRSRSCSNLNAIYGLQLELWVSSDAACYWVIYHISLSFEPWGFAYFSLKRVSDGFVKYKYYYLIWE